MRKLVSRVAKSLDSASPSTKASLGNFEVGMSWPFAIAKEARAKTLAGGQLLFPLCGFDVWRRRAQPDDTLTRPDDGDASELVAESLLRVMELKEA